MRRSHPYGAVIPLAVLLLACGSSNSRNRGSSEARGEAGTGDQAAPSTEPTLDESDPPITEGSHATAPTAAEDEARVAEDDGPPRLTGPSLDAWRTEYQGAVTVEPDDEFPRLARVTELEADIYKSPGDRWAIGAARIGSVLPVKKTGDSGHGCRGEWLEVPGSGHVCSDDVEVGGAGQSLPALDAATSARRPTVTKPVPHVYAKVSRDVAPRLDRLPENAAEVAALAEAVEIGKDTDEVRDIVDRWLKGTYLLALAKRFEIAGEVFYQTTDGYYFRAADFELKPEPQMHGEHLGGATKLPLVFAIVETPLLCEKDDALAECGTIEKHARFPFVGEREIGGETVVEGADGVLARRGDVRVVSKVERPDGVPSTGKWIHIDLSEQSLVAYEGDKARFATLVSSGLKGDTATVPGLFRVDRKYLTKTMRGKDENGPYEVQEVPWTMYYDRLFAVHGAYWHERFGRTKSHGCVNVPPADARWLYYWAELTLPTGWHQMYHKLGTHVYITGDTPPDDDRE